MFAPFCPGSCFSTATASGTLATTCGSVLSLYCSKLAPPGILLDFRQAKRELDLDLNTRNCKT